MRFTQPGQGRQSLGAAFTALALPSVAVGAPDPVGPDSVPSPPSLQVPDSGSSAPRDTSLADMFVSFERTTCYGPCPAYTVDFYGDGTARYVGRKYAPRIGMFDGRAGTRELEEVHDYILSIGFFGMLDDYTDESTDGPTQFVEITLGHRQQRIRDYAQAPPALRRLELLIDSLADTIRWRPVVPDSAVSRQR